MTCKRGQAAPSGAKQELAKQAQTIYPSHVCRFNLNQRITRLVFRFPVAQRNGNTVSGSHRCATLPIDNKANLAAKAEIDC